MALMSYPNVPAIVYKGFGGFLEKEECEEKRILVENQIANIEITRGNTVYIELTVWNLKHLKVQL